jgi:hypothetical protein
LFSTMTRQPSLSPSSFAMIRPMMSGGVPAALGTTMRIMFDGYGCAPAGEAAASIVSMTSGNPIPASRRDTRSCISLLH